MRINNINERFSKCYFRHPASIYSSADSICFFNDFLYFIESANTHNFADDNSVTASSYNIQNLIHFSEAESSAVVKWFKGDEMIVNPGKFQALIFDKKKSNQTQGQIILKTFLCSYWCWNNLQFAHYHYLQIATNQLDALIRVGMFTGFENKMFKLIVSFIKILTIVH